MAKRRKRYKKGVLKRIVGFFSFVATYVVRLLPSAMGVGIVALFFFGVKTALYADPSLNIQRIDVIPSHDLPAYKIRQLEKKYLGKNLLNVNLKAIAKDLQRHPEVQRAEVIRQFPSALVVEMNRRSAVASVQLSKKGQYGWISEDGMILEVASEPLVARPTIHLLESKKNKFAAGSKIKAQGLKDALKFLELYRSQDFARREPLTHMNIDRLGNVTIVLQEGPSIRMGTDPKSRLVALEKIIPLFQTQGRHTIDYVDLQYDDVVVKRKGS